MKLLRVFFIVSTVMIMGSCSLKPRSWWTEGEIGVIADQEDWEILRSPLERVYERVVRTPQIEPMFTIRYVPESDIERYTNYRYLILAATLESEGRVGQIVERVVSDPEIRQGVEEGEYYVFTQRDQWAQNQLMIILVAKDLMTLREKIETNEEFLYAIFDADWNEQLEEDMFARGEQKDIEEELMAIYGWSMRIQRDYYLIQEIPEEGFIWFRRLYPERWIFVRWIDGGDTTLLDPYWIIKERNRIGAEYYGGDRVNSDQFLFSRRSTFLGRQAQVTTGLWENDGKVAGGPFINYTFHDSLSRRVYMVDVAVFAPARDKMPYLRRLDVLAHTFHTVFDMGT